MPEWGGEAMILDFGFAPLSQQKRNKKRHLRLTARGFTNLRDGHRRLRFCLSATAVTDEQVAGGPPTTNGRRRA